MGHDPDETDLSVRTAGQRIAGFELIQRIDTDANNAFGEVWLAKRVQPFQRVAIKFLRRDRVNEEMVERFSRAESKALARFNHPYIARFYELGFHGHVPYLVMQYVPGDRITAYADAHGLSVAERLRLMAKVCDAVQHVHLQGVVHRDLKPANILVSESRPEVELARDGDGRARAEEDSSAGRGPIPVLIDFGLAKSSNPDAPLSSAVVSRGGFVGSRAYASPEQITARNPEDTGQPADIYALGAVLFELVAGVSPMEHVLSDTTLSALERDSHLAKDDRPSMAEAYARLPLQRQAAIARARGIGVPEMRRLLRSRLAHLTDRALRQDPKSRFSDARAFALDIGNYLAERDYLEAAAEPRAEKWRRAVRRHRGVVAAVGAVTLALAAGFGTAVLKAKEAADARDVAEAQRDRANNLLAAIAADSALQSAQNGRYEQLRSDLKVLDELGQLDRFDVRLAVAMSDQSLGKPLRGHEGAVTSVSFSPDGRTLASAGNDRTVRLWDLSTREPRGVPLRGHEAGVYGVMFSPDGRMLASASVDMTVRMWDVSTGKPLGDPLRGHTDDVTGVAFSPDGQTLASASHDSKVRLWDARTRVPLGEPLQGHDGWVYSVSFSPDGQTLASAGADGTLRLWDVSTGKPLGEPLRGHEGQVTSVRFSPDGRTLVSGSMDETARLWDVATGRPLSDPLHGHERPVICVSISGDSRMVASAGADKTVRLWDVPTGEQLGEPLRGHEGMVWSVSLARDGRTLASGSTDGTIRMWDASAGNALGAASRGHEAWVFSVSFSPDGQTLATGSVDGTIRMWDSSTGQPLGEPLRGHEGSVASVAFSPNGRMLASGSLDDTIRLWDMSTGYGASLPCNAGGVVSVCFSPDGRRLASASKDNLIRLWDAATGRQLGAPLRGHEGGVSNVCFSPNGLRLASGGEDGTIRLWDALTGLALGNPLRGHEGGVTSVCFSPDGQTLASAGSDRIVRLWNASTAEPLGELLHEGMIVGVCFSPDGRTLASGSFDGTIRLWDAPTGKPLGEPLRVREGAVFSMSFSPDGRTLATGGGRNVRLWHAVPMRDRIDSIRARLAQVDLVRAQLQDQIAAVGIEEADVSSFQDRVLADPRFEGDLRTAALIVVGEVGLDRQATRTRQALDQQATRTRQASERAARLQAMKEAQNAKDWTALLALLSQADPADTATLDARFWNEVAWMGLTELPADSPARDLTRLLSYAERAVELTERNDGAILDTLARAHWELGDKPKALEVQAEAIKAAESQVAAIAEAEQRTALETSLKDLRDTLARYEREEPPAPR